MMFEVSKSGNSANALFSILIPPENFACRTGFGDCTATLISAYPGGGIIFKIQPVKWKIGNQTFWIENQDLI